jgi:hypothetical protein
MFTDEKDYDDAEQTKAKRASHYDLRRVFKIIWNRTPPDLSAIAMKQRDISRNRTIHATATDVKSGVILANPPANANSE